MLTTEAERGSVLVLMPVAALVFVVLGALALDATVVFMAERELAGAAAAAANDAVAAAIDEEEFYASGCVLVVPGEALAVVRRSLAAKRLDDAGLRMAEPEVAVTDGTTVTVTLRGRAPHVFARALPGRLGSSAVAAAATATARSADGVAAGC